MWQLLRKRSRWPFVLHSIWYIWLSLFFGKYQLALVAASEVARHALVRSN